MVSGRDDFVIAIRSAFLKKGTQQRFSLFSLILLSLIFLALGSLNFKPINYLKIFINEIVYRSSFIVSAPENYIKNTYFTIKGHFNLYSENEKIKLELENLKKTKLLDEFLIYENNRLKKVVDDFYSSSEKILAKVLSDKQSPFLRSIVVNKGSKDGIKMGMVVLDKDYLVGKIVEVNYSTSRVILLSDLNSKIPVFIEPNGVQAIISGSGKSYGIIEFTRKNLSEEKNLNAKVYTSGHGQLFKPGIPVGNLIWDDELNKNKVDFFSDFTQLNFVKITSYERKESEWKE